jgi:Calx-beta domain
VRSKGNMSRIQIALLFAVLALVSSISAAQTFLSLDSQPGDYIGQGVNQSFTPSDGTFVVQKLSNGVQFSFHTADYSSNWNLFFGPASGLTLTRSEYEGAQRFAFHSPTKPGMDVSGDGRGCNTIIGRFLVSSVIFNGTGGIQSLAIDFEQHCEGMGPALFGSVRYNSSVTAVPRVSVGDGNVLKGNVGTSDGTVTLSLSLPSSFPVSVQYATADRTALAGTDYVATSGTATFQPGVTSQTITVPVLGDRLARGNKNFQVRLSAPVGAPLGDGEGNVRILDPNGNMTVLAMSGQPGDYIGGGQLYLFTIADGNFTASRNYDNGVSVGLQAGDAWTLDFAAPNSATLTAGTYTNAMRFPFQSGGAPGLDVSGAGRGCNTLTGQFVVNRVSYTTTGVSAFSADFEQHCEGAIPALFGSIRVNTSLRQFSVSDAVISGGSAVFTVTLNPSSTTTSSVNFATADGTAVAGTDYTATSQTLTFAPGQNQQTVAVPLLTNGGSQKKFFGQLSSPTGFQVWISQASASF